LPFIRPAGGAPALQLSAIRCSFVLPLIFIFLHALPTRAQAVSVAAEIFVSVPDQELVLLDRGKVIVRYPISTSKFGLGDGNGTYRTPLGTLYVSGRFGDRLPAGAVIKSRVATGEIVDPNAPGRDAIVSRVIWLRGKEQQNRAAHDRCIYIHGTPEERRIGRPASFGCIRMRSKDVIALYGFAHIGMHVTVTQKRIGDLLPPEEPSLLARAD
jgi:lipoprotein-anchoring transpeptidase ErfK/SrfK